MGVFGPIIFDLGHPIITGILSLTLSNILKNSRTSDLDEDGFVFVCGSMLKGSLRVHVAVDEKKMFPCKQ